jgi:hypothetical protein
MTNNIETCKRIADELNEAAADYESLIEYFEDALDIEYRIGSNKQYRSVRIMITCGGPNIFIDTKTDSVDPYWGTEHASWPLDYDTSSLIDSLFRDYFEMC